MHPRHILRVMRLQAGPLQTTSSVTVCFQKKARLAENSAHTCNSSTQESEAGGVP